MGQLKIIPNEEPQLKLFPDVDEGDIFEKGRDYLRENFLAVLEKITEEAKKGNLQAVRFLYPDISKLLIIEEKEIDINAELEKLPDEPCE